MENLDDKGLSEDPNILLIAKERHFERDERVIITGGRWVERFGTFIKKNGSTWLISIDDVAVRGICPLYVQRTNQNSRENLNLRIQITTSNNSPQVNN